MFAGFAGRFTYITISDLMYDLLHRDKVTKAITGLLTGSIMLAWLGGQAMGLGYIFQQFTNINPVPVIIFFNAVFILYTYMGGVLSVVWTDFIQGIFVVVFGLIFYYFALAPVHWDIAELGTRLTVAAGPEFWDFSRVPIWTILVNFITGCFGVLAAQVYWQRCFAAKDANTARTAMPWLMMNYVPLWAVAVVYALVLAAAMSSADSMLNAAAIIVVNDVIRPFKADTTDQLLVTWTKRATIIIGVVACLLALYAESIIGLFAKAYTMAGGGVVPVLIVGLLWKTSRTAFRAGEKNSRLTPWGVRTAVVSGAIVSLMFSILWGILVATALAIVVSVMTKGRPPEAGHDTLN